MSKKDGVLVFCLTLFLTSCQADRGSAPGGFLSVQNTSQAGQRISPKQEIALKDGARMLTLNLDEAGNGLVSYSHAETEAFVIENYTYKPVAKPLTFSYHAPSVVWEGAGKGEMIFLGSDTFPRGISPNLPSQKMKIPLKLTSAQLNNYQLVASPQTYDYQQAGMQFTSPSPVLDEQGSGYLSGLIRPRVFEMNTLDRYQLAYVPIQAYRLQERLVSLADSVKSRQFPAAWFNAVRGLVMVNPRANTWVIQEVVQHKLQAPETVLGESTAYPSVRIDREGNGFIALRTKEDKLTVHTIQQLKHVKSESIEVKLPAGMSFEMAIFEGKGVLLSYTLPVTLSSDANIELQMSLIENNKLTRTDKLLFPLADSLPFGLALDVNSQGKGLIVLGTGQRNTPKGKMHLFPLTNFRLQP